MLLKTDQQRGLTNLDKFFGPIKSTITNDEYDDMEFDGSSFAINSEIQKTKYQNVREFQIGFREVRG